MTSEQFLKGITAFEELLKEQEQLRRDGLIFIWEKGLWKDFLQYHTIKIYKKKENTNGD